MASILFKVETHGRGRRSLNNNTYNPENDRSDRQPVENREGVVLSIDTGLLARAERFIDKESFLIGADTDADIILLDEGIIPIHLAITISRSVFGISISLRAIAEGVILNNKPLAAEEVTHVQKIANIQIAGVQLRIQDAKGYRYADTSSEVNEEKSSEDLEEISIEAAKEGDSSGNGTGNRKLLLLASIAAACLGLATFLQAFDLVTTEELQSIDSQPKDINKQKADPIKFLSQLKERIEQAGLSSEIQARVINGDEISVDGSLQKGHEKKWFSVLQWYDAQQNPPQLFSKVEQGAEANNIPVMKYVWFGESPYVVLQNNEKVKVGETINGGWKIDKVNTSGVVLSMANRQFLVKFE